MIPDNRLVLFFNCNCMYFICFTYVSIWQELKISYSESEDGLEFVQNASEWDTAFVLENFEGPIFHKLLKAEAWIVGPTVIFQCAKDKKVNI